MERKTQKGNLCFVSPEPSSISAQKKAPSLSLIISLLPLLCLYELTSPALASGTGTQGVVLAAQSPNAERFALYLNEIASQVPAGSDLATVFQILETLPNGESLTNTLEKIQPGHIAGIKEVASNVVKLFINPINLELNTLYTSQFLNNEFSNVKDIKPSVLSNFIQHVTSHSPQNISSQFKQLQASTQQGHYKVNTLGPLSPSQRQLPQNIRVKVGKATFWTQQANQFLKFNNGGKYNLVGIQSQTVAFTVGADYLFSDSFIMGVVGSYGNTHFDLKSDRGHGKINSYTMGLYGSWTSPKAFYLGFFGQFGQHHFLSQRHISFSNIERSAKGNYWDTGAAGSLEVGYVASLPCNYSLQSFANMSYALLHQPTYREKGAGALNMRIWQKTRYYNEGSVGLELARLFTYAATNSIIRPSMRIAYRTQSALGSSDKLTASLVNHGEKFTVKGSKKHRDFFNVGASIAALSSEKIYVMMTYNGNFNKKDQVQEGLFRIGWKI